MAQILDGTWVRNLGYHKTYRSAQKAVNEMAYTVHVSGEFLRVKIVKTIAFHPITLDDLQSIWDPDDDL